MRHAKSSWKYPHLNDFERPLNSRGKRNAPMMGRILRDESVMFDQIISSPAKRAITTARTIASEMGYSEDNIAEERRFYGAHPSTIIEILKDLDNSVSHAAVFGHNPTFHSLVEQLVNTTIEKFPTCAAATISLDIDTWRELKAASGTLTAFRLPRDYTDK
ncbi:MAG: histidine phosphatase family protein [Candidatus Marinimicrobia bacterium]|nr:histidine phosphatase family protein [Candidatus Neomarinimicrobiota bacterium]MDP7716427.1 histidine phosphatase family protein [Candidatus Neomarinimicrobiota bacterium]|tara:strand:+ start:281 stop:763 length:483 start_codon:yes stop_codon:yes gene_type:complete